MPIVDEEPFDLLNNCITPISLVCDLQFPGLPSALRSLWSLWSLTQLKR